MGGTEKPGSRAWVHLQLDTAYLHRQSQMHILEVSLVALRIITQQVTGSQVSDTERLKASTTSRSVINTQENAWKDDSKSEVTCKWHLHKENRATMYRITKVVYRPLETQH